MFTLHTFGDSILDCARYNAFGVHPGALLVRNDDARFPDFAGHDLASRGPAALAHRAQDGATAADLPYQLRGVVDDGPAAALLTVGGNDLLRGLVLGGGFDVDAFGRQLEAFAAALPVRPLLIGNVYDPSIGDDSRNFLPVTPRVAREAHRRLDDAIADVAARHGTLVDLHAHFLTGDPSWFTSTIEPSLVGASEVRRAFLPHVLGAWPA